MEETLAPGASVARVARAQGVNANQVFAWRRQYRQGLLETSSGRGSQLLAVGVVETGRQAAGSHGSPAQRALSGLMHLEFPKGQLRIAGRVDTEVLRVAGGRPFGLNFRAPVSFVAFEASGSRSWESPHRSLPSR